jgi:hypothetical protein
MLTPIESAHAAQARIRDRLSVTRLGRSMMREADADILAMREADAALGGVIAYAESAKATGERILADSLTEHGTTIAQLVRDLVDPDDCWFDHHGGCQAHGYLSLQPGEMCPQAEAKAWLAKVHDA